MAEILNLREPVVAQPAKNNEENKNLLAEIMPPPPQPAVSDQQNSKSLLPPGLAEAQNHIFAYSGLATKLSTPKPHSAAEQRAARAMRDGEDALLMLKAETHTHERFKKSETYLGRAFDWIYPKEQQSLQQLREMRESQTQALQARNIPALVELNQNVDALIDRDRQAITTKANVDLYGGAAIKTGFLFLKGNPGIIGTTAAFAVDQAKPATSWDTQVVDGLLGAVKGRVSAYAFNKIGSSDLNIGIKGVSMSFLSRALDAGFTRETWLNDNGTFDAQKGLLTTATETFDPRAIAVDAVVFGTTQLALKGTDVLQNALDKSAFARTVGTATVFGFTHGADSEALRQSHAGNPINLQTAEQILKAGGLGAAQSAFSSIAAGIQSDAKLQDAIKNTRMLNIPPLPELHVGSGAPAH